MRSSGEIPPADTESLAADGGRARDPDDPAHKAARLGPARPDNAVRHL